MKKSKGRLLTCMLLFMVTACAAQNASQLFSPLSADAYSARIKMLKARTAPVEYTDKKEQKTYAEIISDRNKSILYDFEHNKVVADTLLLNKSNAIIQRIKNANKKYAFDSIAIFINRSPVANASCYGEGTLFINLGLFLWIDNEEELALIIGHELSHQLLNHSETKIKKNIALISSDEFKDEMKAIKKASDGRYLRYKKLVTDLVTQNGTHSRYKESEADSLGVELIRNAGYDIRSAAKVLLKLDHVDDLFVAGNMYDVRAAFKDAVPDSFIFKKPKKYNGLSSVTVTMNADKALDSVKTHPDCVVRYKKILADNNNLPETNCCKTLNSSMAVYKERALVELVRYEYEIRRYTLCAHLCALAMNNGYTDPFYSSVLSMSFSGIFAADKKLEKFSVTDAAASAGSTLKELQDMIFNANSESIDHMAGYFLTKTSASASDDYNYAQLKYNEQVKGLEGKALQQKFSGSFPASKYSYLFNPKTN